MASLLITRDRTSGKAQFRVVQGQVVGQGQAGLGEGWAGQTERPRTHDARDVRFPAWCEMHGDQLRRMLRYLRCRLSHVEGTASWDWEGVAACLSRYVYATSANRRKLTPSIV